MKFEMLKKYNKKKIAIGVIAVISIVSVLIFTASFAKYKLTQSIPLANGTINYTVPDLNMIAIYQENDSGGYDKVETIPTSGYTFSNESYCATLKGESFEKNEDIIVNYNMDTKTISVVPIAEKTRCYLYFDKKVTASDTILDRINNQGIFTDKDDDGDSYYWRGDAGNNYLKFANRWWRIIRINGDGTIRIIYSGTTYHSNNHSTTDSQIGTSAFNLNYNDNAYVGFMYGSTGASTYEATHTNTNKSTILISLGTWYTNKLASYASKIDTNAGFCGDRSINTGSETWWSSDTKKGFGTNATAYGPFSRTTNIALTGPKTTFIPTFKCPNTNDLYTVKEATRGNNALTYPIGLITVDEAVYAGLLYGTTENHSYNYLYNGQAFWTMSPHYMDTNGTARVFLINSNNFGGSLVTGQWGVRPVINLRADVQITGSGTSKDPFIVN